MRDMRMAYLLLPLLVLTGCAAPTHTPRAAQPPAKTWQAPAFTKDVDVAVLGQRIWKNECAGTIPGLVSWNNGEDFPSLGIGHFIWYPAGVQARFDESWPRFVKYAKARGVSVPSFLQGAAPWSTKKEFETDRSGLANSMRRWLAAHVALQTEFIIIRSRVALPKMLQCSNNPTAVRARYEALARTTQGMYCLVDYVNFKGEGTKPSERYNGQGWGLLQVLENMRGNPQGSAATAEFSRSASEIMRRRVANAPAARGEQRWLAGWLNRCSTYK